MKMKYIKSQKMIVVYDDTTKVVYQHLTHQDIIPEDFQKAQDFFFKEKNKNLN